MERINYQNLPNCIRLTNGEIEIIVTTDVGPRILSYGFVGGENVLGLHPEAIINSELGEYKLYGGHRLWIAPENMPNSYAPDNAPVEYSYDEQKNSIHLIQPVESVSNTQKEITVKLDETGSGIAINHKITNCGNEEIELAPWALTIMRGGGVCEIPNEPFASYSAEILLPVRNLTVWSYTDLSDSRWSFDREYIRLRVETGREEPQKIGVLNKQGSVNYKLDNLTFTKKFDFQKNANYPDMNSNMELYTAGSFIEIETLAPLQRLGKNNFALHEERWELNQI